MWQDFCLDYIYPTYFPYIAQEIKFSAHDAEY